MKIADLNHHKFCFKCYHFVIKCGLLYFFPLFFSANRHFGRTNMNEKSSRSHTIFRVVCFLNPSLTFKIKIHIQNVFNLCGKIWRYHTWINQLSWWHGNIYQFMYRYYSINNISRQYWQYTTLREFVIKMFQSKLPALNDEKYFSNYGKEISPKLILFD